MYANLVVILEHVHFDNGRIALDDVEHRLTTIKDPDDFGTLAAGTDEERNEVYTRLGFTDAERATLETILEAAFGG